MQSQQTARKKSKQQTRTCSEQVAIRPISASLKTLSTLLRAHLRQLLRTTNTIEEQRVTSSTMRKSNLN